VIICDGPNATQPEKNPYAGKVKWLGKELGLGLRCSLVLLFLLYI
jgi:hypothetical protein